MTHVREGAIGAVVVIASAAKWFGGILTSVLAGYMLWWLTQPSKPEYPGHRVPRTQNLGIEFNQDGGQLFLDPESQELVMEPRAFEIRVPDVHWRSDGSVYPVLQVAVSADPEDA
jgi:hypothetical protein